jgi:hypothetical protein
MGAFGVKKAKRNTQDHLADQPIGTGTGHSDLI